MRQQQVQHTRLGSNTKASTSIAKVAPIVAVAGWAILGFSQTAFAQSGDSERRCLAEVSETMVRVQIKQLEPEIEEAVAGLCELGNTRRATRMVMAVGASQRCKQGVDTHIADNNLDVAEDARSRAYEACRGGNLKTALRFVVGSPTKAPAAPPEITSFVASSATVNKGGTVTLSWRTSNADKVTLSEKNPAGGIINPRDVSGSGSQSVSPDRTTTYILLARRAGTTRADFKQVQIQVSRPTTIASTCSISGRVTGNLRDQGFELTHVGIFIPGELNPEFREEVDSRGRYTFEDVPGDQEFRVAPLGGWQYHQRTETVSCFAGRTVRVDLHVLGARVD